MKLIDLSTTERKDLAKKLGVGSQMVYQWAIGQDNMSVNKAMQIQRETGGRVMCYEAAFPKIDFNW